MIFHMDLLILELEWGQRNNMEKDVNANKNFENLSKDDFVIVKKEEHIKDVKFETKSTTFARDALKRFCKNKSSVVAAFIIGILILLSIIVPIASPYESNANVSHPTETLLLPKLFNPKNSSWWNGTKKYYNEAVYIKEDGSYDLYNETFRESAIVKIGNVKTNYTNTSVEYGTGGYFLANSNYTLPSENATTSSRYYVQTNTKMNYRKKDNILIDFEFGITDEAGNVLDEYKNIDGGILSMYRFYFTDGDTFYYFYHDNASNSWKYADIDDSLAWSNDYVDYVGNRAIDVSQILTEVGYSSLDGMKFGVEVKLSSVSNAYTIFKTIKFNYNKETVSEVNQSKFDDISMLDACKKTQLQAKDEATSTVNYGYYQSTCNKQVYKAVYYTVDFVYDVYEATYGEREVTNFGKSDLDNYISKGWCEYDYTVGPSSFKLLNDKCPVRKIYNENKIVLDSGSTKIEVITFDALVSNYRYLGYSKMPKYLLGTDNAGLDLITKCFRGLRTSLVLSFLTATVCFIFGLVWGAISGYFGGNVDLLMERFCEILGGVPWIVVMTLCILHLGNNFVTFVLALCLTGWMGTAGRTRTQFYRFKGREYILASRTLGASETRLIFKHILPNALGTIITGAVLLIPSCIFSEATLSYLQLGLQGKVSFGTILSKNQQFISTYPALIVFPSVIISLIMISFNLFGNGLRDAVNPSLKGSD